ncbi:sodium:proton antiporter [Candidatus Aerophobetes bacterium]|uniref:Sodium:proton antiporter n=1 Tax=Aerophobetes bacterium TaxID=2030807 RepID=A0A497E5E6_UNCAE|nr:MAG: sodium:proton antiporter [Candidatus Aerophobetes bacterium]
MTVIVKTIAKFVVPPIILFGIYIVLHGHLTPGGGFAGGVIVGSAFILLTLAFGKEVAFQKLKRSTASVLESVGALIFLSLALLGIAAGGWFFLNFLPKGHPLRILSAGFIPLANIGIGIKVGAGIFAVFLTLIVFRVSAKK